MRFIQSQTEQSVNSTARAESWTNVQPFTLSGPLETGLSVMWSPPHPILLKKGYVMARIAGDSSAVFAIGQMPLIKNWEQPSDILIETSLAAGAFKRTFTFSTSLPKIINPSESLFVATFAAGGQEDIVFQLIGVRI